MKWWLISDDDMQAIRAYLLALELSGDDLAKDALHTLDSGLNTTDAIPDDWKDEEDESA